jgi:sugar O-acyltransferase (sialic acid O-acetyltransferase NeuD family)
LKLDLWIGNELISRVGLLGAGAKSRELISMIGEISVEFQAVNSDFRTGNLVDISTLLDMEAETPLICAVGSPGLRRNMTKEFKRRSFASAYTSESFADGEPEIQAGCILSQRAFVNTNVSIGNHVHIDSGAIVGHDSVIDDYATLSAGATISGGVRIGAGSFIGAGATIIERIELAPGVLIGAGAVVTKSILRPGAYVGVPARYVSSKTGWDALQ